MFEKKSNVFSEFAYSRYKSIITYIPNLDLPFDYQYQDYYTRFFYYINKIDKIYFNTWFSVGMSEDFVTYYFGRTFVQKDLALSEVNFLYNKAKYISIIDYDEDYMDIGNLYIEDLIRDLMAHSFVSNEEGKACVTIKSDFFSFFFS